MEKILPLIATSVPVAFALLVVVIWLYYYSNSNKLIPHRSLPGLAVVSLLLSGVQLCASVLLQMPTHSIGLALTCFAWLILSTMMTVASSRNRKNHSPTIEYTPLATSDPTGEDQTSYNAVEAAVSTRPPLLLRVVLILFVLTAITADVILLSFGELAALGGDSQQQQQRTDGGVLVVGLTVAFIRLVVELAVLTLLLLQQSTGSHPSAFANFMDKMATLLPFMWPSGNRFLQSMIFACLALVGLERVINVLVPMQYKIVVDSIGKAIKGVGPPAGPFLIFTLLRFMQGSSGAISTIQSTLWVPVEQFTTRQVSVRMFDHLHGLSLRWHLNRKTGEVLRVIDRGNQAISTLVSYIWFSIVPVIVDILIAVVYFMVEFDVYFGLIVLLTMVLYLLLTVVLTEWRTKFRRNAIELENATNTRAVDSLLNFETVKYFANEQFESQSFDSAVRQQQRADLVSQYSLRLLNTVQNLIITMGMLGGGLYCFRRISDGVMDVGDFVLFVAYLLQLYQPLNWFGTYFRMVQKNFIDMEKLLDLFKETPEVKDLPMAPDVVVTKGRVIFDNVSFTYDPQKATRPTLDSISFEIEPGKTVALVGPSGSGKSTCLRLLFRLYDVQSGNITIDGQDIRHCTQSSVRKSIGVVPQDTVLFNDSILYNIRYAKIDASERAVEEAAKQAQIHDKIMQFPDKYNTAVGERGLRLSGGEKQRVAIARTLLKDPKIVLLDEATSALDTQTERAIQSALATMTSGRTTLVVAHRLSTIVGSDLILVLVDGRIVERGTFHQLMDMKGRFHEMWQKQLEK